MRRDRNTCLVNDLRYQANLHVDLGMFGYVRVESTARACRCMKIKTGFRRAVHRNKKWVDRAANRSFYDRYESHEIETMRAALKEWAAVCRALGHGRTSLILRRGGVADPSGSFHPEHAEFLLFPTRFHQEPSGLRAEARPDLDAARAEAPPDGFVRLALFARVTHSIRVPDDRTLRALRPHHVWSDATAQERLHREGEGTLLALVVRVLRLPAAVDLPAAKEYEGCRSWVELESDVAVEGAKPVLDDASFMAVESRIRTALAGTRS